MEAKQKQSKFDKFLGVMERVGNKVPDPILLFIWLMIITILLSFVCSMLGVSAIHPVTGETITVLTCCPWTASSKCLPLPRATLLASAP